MARPDRRRPGSAGEPQPNVLAEGNPVPNVLRGSVRPSSAGQAGRPAGREAETTGRPWRRAASRDVGRGTPAGGPSPERPTGEKPAGRRASIPGCGCGGWLALLFLLYLAMQAMGSCETGALLPAPGGTVDVDRLQQGECFRWHGDSDVVSVVAAVDCAEAHDAEVTGLVELPDPAGAPYDETTVTAESAARCSVVFSAYAGEEPPTSSGAGSSYIYPGAEGWEQGDRTLICLAEGRDPGGLSGSVRSGGR